MPQLLRQLLSILLVSALLGGQSIAGMHGIAHFEHTPSKASQSDANHSHSGAWLGHNLGEHACAAIDELAAGGLLPSAVQILASVYAGLPVTAHTETAPTSELVAWFNPRAPPAKAQRSEQIPIFTLP